MSEEFEETGVSPSDALSVARAQALLRLQARAEMTEPTVRPVIGANAWKFSDHPWRPGGEEATP